MASELVIMAVGTEEGDDHLLDQAVAQTVVLLDRLEARWSRFLPDSDVTRLNNAPGNWVTIDPTTVTLVLSMVEAWQSTGGAFDPSVLPVLTDAGYRASIDNPWNVTILPDGQLLSMGGTGPTMGAIDVDRDRLAARLPVGLVIDPGGLGKGLAADFAVRQLLDLGAAGALVSIGGDMTMLGKPPGGATGWVVSVESPDPPYVELCRLAVDGGGVATSSTRSRRWVHDGVESHHLIDPHAMAVSSTDLASVTVIAGSGCAAEVHATAALLAGPAGAVEYLEFHGLTGLAIGLDRSLHATTDIAQELAVS